MNPVKEKHCKCGKMFKQYNSLQDCNDCEYEKKKAKMRMPKERGLSITIKRKDGKMTMYKPIRKVSKSREKENREYSKLRVKFLEENPRCAVYPHLRATQVHHKKGRIGRLLCDVRYFLPVSDKGHRWVELHPEEAKKLGYSLSRLEK